MLYLLRSQINVPRDRHLGNSSHLNVADEGLAVFETVGEVFGNSRTAREVLDKRTGAGRVQSSFSNPASKELQTAYHQVSKIPRKVVLP